MANEAQVRSQLTIQKRSGSLSLIDYRSGPATFVATVSGTKGPVPGAFRATEDGTDVDLSELDSPGLCRVMNLDADNPVTLGRWDNDAERFYPVMKLLPGESFVIRLADDVADEYSGTGTGTTAASTTLRVKAHNAACNVLVEAFEA